MFEKMQIKVMGGTGEESKSDISSGSDDEEEEDELDKHFIEDPNKISQKHQRHIDIEERDREDMDFPDEVDTPFTNARVRF